MSIPIVHLGFEWALKRRLSILATVAFFVMIPAIVVLADLASLGPVVRIYSFPLGDKVGHLMLFGLASLLAVRVASQPETVKPLVIAAGSIAALATLEELSQLFIRTRSFDIGDLVASYAGVAVPPLVVVLLRRRACTRCQPMSSKVD